MSSSDRHMIIIGGGLAGLSAGCYALRNGYRTTLIEHNRALGGVCTSWHREPYTVDGCIHWLTGGPFERLYQELDIVPAVPLRTLETWMTYRDARDGFEVAFTRDLDAWVRQLGEVSPPDIDELARLRRGARDIVAMQPPLNAPEFAGARENLRALWDAREALGSLVHFRQPVSQWASRHLSSPRLQRIIMRLFPGTAPAYFVLMVLGYLEKGYLSRPVGGTAAFIGALERSYRALGGEAILNATVDEIVTHNGCATGVHLTDGTMLASDIVISTASSPETVLHLLGGAYDARLTRERLARWKLFDPIVLASFGTSLPYTHEPSMLLIDGIDPLDTGGRTIDNLYVRVCNDEPSIAPDGHCVIQAMLPTEYTWWATLGPRYAANKDALGNAVLERLDPHFAGLRQAVRMTDIATPLTFWNRAHSWRGAYEGWMPNTESFFGHVEKTLTGLSGFYMAGQWVEPGGGVPMAVMSGRQAIQLVCHDEQRSFIATSA